ncbi:PTPRQ-like protein, partial [Mya arenaria]
SVGTSIWGSCTVPRSGSSGNPCSSQNSICTGSSGEGLGTCSCLSGYYPSATNVCSQIGTSIGVSCTKPSSGSIGSPCSAPASQCTGTSGEGAGTCSCLSGYYPSATNVCSTKPNPPTWKEATDVNPANDHTITVSWNAPSGSVYGYQVSLVDGSTPVLSTAIISKSQSNTVDSVPLKHVIKTEVIAPGPPTGANCKDVKDEFIIVGWNAPVVPNGDLRQCFVHVYNTSGTYYTFKIYTQNELFNSTSSDATHCQTNARMSDPPEDLSASAVSSRGFTVSWQKPVNTYSEEILGYLLQVKAGETCVVERQFKCSNCYGISMNGLCSTGNISVLHKTKAELKERLQFDTNSLLLPDTTYTSYVGLINDVGLGHKANVSELTFEEEPQAPPVNVSVDNIRKTSFNVSWSLIGPRPGQVTYTVMLTADTGADSKTYDVTGYKLHKTLIADGLEEYWNYTVKVTARTNVGDAKTSDTTQEYRTLPSAPGAVTEFEAVKAEQRSDNFHRMTIHWKAPSLLERNSVIKEYVLKYNVGNITTNSGVAEELNTKSFPSETGDGFYREEFNVIPESTYQFEVRLSGIIKWQSTPYNHNGNDA